MSGYKIVLTADHSLMTEFRGIALFGFLSCAPKEYVPGVFYNRIFAPIVDSLPNGGAKYAQYGLRKVEATLLKGGFKREDVIVAHPLSLDKVIGDETKIIGIYTMDPLGIGPVTTSFKFDKDVTPYNRIKFLELIKTISKLRPNGCKVVLGGGGGWQFESQKTRDKLGIDHVLFGECEADICSIFHDILDGNNVDEFIKMSPPKVEQIPTIIKPSISFLVEVMRGCGRMCKFCDPALRYARNIPVEKIKKEVKVNQNHGKHNVWLHAEDIFLYNNLDNKDFYPNHDAILNLYKEIKNMEGIEGVGATHCSLSAVAADPELIKDISDLLGTGSRHWLGTQPGIETGSPRLLGKHAAQKAKPFSPEEWPDVVRNAIGILNKNYWHPACTLMVGMPGETKEDVQETIDLVESLKGSSSVLAPLFFVPRGAEEKEHYFTMENISQKQFELIYKCWAHNIKQFKEGVWMATSMFNLPIRMLYSIIVKFGSRWFLRFLRNYGKKIDRK